MTEVTANLKKGSFKKTFASVLAACLTLTLIPIAGSHVQGSVLSGNVTDIGCVTDGNAAAKQALTTSGNGTYFHTFGEPTFAWAEDGNSCKATFTCAMGDDTLVADCEITSATKTAASEKKQGVAVKTATVTVYQTTYTSTKEVVIPKVADVTLSKTEYNYTGKLKTPKVTVKDTAGKVIDSSNYTLEYVDNKNVGEASVTVNFNGSVYTGAITKEFTISPRSTKIAKVTSAKKGFEVTWTKRSAQVSGYQVRYSTSAKFTTGTTKTISISKKSTTAQELTGLKSKKKYYVQVRTYKTVDGTIYYSEWSDAVAVKTK